MTTRSLALLLLAVLGLAACESTGTDPDPGPGPGGSPGTLTLVTATSGTQPDSNGYTIMLDGTAHGSIGPTDSVTVEGLEPGSHAVELADIEFNCATLGQFTRTVTVGSDAGAVVDYGVACDAESRSRISFVRYPSLQQCRGHAHERRWVGPHQPERQPGGDQAADAPPVGQVVARWQAGGLHPLGWWTLRDHRRGE